MVNHVLFLKLSHNGIRGSSLDWFEPYVKGGLQCVSIKYHSSILIKVTYGTSQGSVLGLLLFLI